MDSHHLCRTPGRIGIIVKIISKFLTNLRRHHRELFDELGVEVVAPAMSGAKKDRGLGLEDFEFSERGEVLKCPAGHAPVKKKTNRKKGRHSAGFDSEKCSACPHAHECPTRPGDKHRYLRYNNKQARLARRRAFERTPGFKGRYRMRAGIEATMSDLDRLTNIKRLRVRGMKAVRFSATLKATAVNIFRATAVRAARKAANPVLPSPFPLLLRPVYVFKERFLLICRDSCKFLSPAIINHQLVSQTVS